MSIVLSVLIGFLLDCLFGDPPNLWHPVCAIGKLISKTEAFLRRIFPQTPTALVFAGILLWIIVCSLSFLVPLGVLYLLSLIHPALALIVNTFFCYQIFARKSLADAGKDVYIALARSLEEGRKAVSMYVGRDTQSLDETGVIKATVETIAENTTDGVIAPMIFMLIGGAPLGFLYKAVNTLDSMVGYHNDRYEYLGKFSAKADDVFNFIPARLSAICMIAAAGMLHFDNRNALRIFRRDRKNHKSPNSAQTESVCAGALHIQLAGDASYFGKKMEKPFIGDPDRPITRTDIACAERLMTGASFVMLVLGVAIRLACITSIV